MHDFKLYDILRVNSEFFKQTQNQGEFGYFKLVFCWNFNFKTVCHIKSVRHASTENPVRFAFFNKTAVSL